MTFSASSSATVRFCWPRLSYVWCPVPRSIIAPHGFWRGEPKEVENSTSQVYAHCALTTTARMLISGGPTAHCKCLRSTVPFMGSRFAVTPPTSLPPPPLNHYASGDVTDNQASSLVQAVRGCCCFLRSRRRLPRRRGGRNRGPCLDPEDLRTSGCRAGASLYLSASKRASFLYLYSSSWEVNTSSLFTPSRSLNSRKIVLCALIGLRVELFMRHSAKKCPLETELGGADRWKLD